MFGNEIYEYGCARSSKLHHTTYLSIRSADKNLQLNPWRFGWNYLHDNHTKNGIHQYDESYKGPLCGSPNGTVIINDNVIINQAGSGDNTKIYWNENVFYSKKDKPFVNYSYQGDHLMDNIIGDYNAWFYPNAANGASKAIPPIWDKNPFTTDPLITFVGTKIKIAKESPLVGEGEIGDIATDIYGIPRTLGVTVIGAVTARALEPSIPNTLTIELSDRPNELNTHLHKLNAF